MDEKDIFNSIQDIANGLKNFKQFQQFHCDVQPANIYVLDNKSFKLADVCFLNDGRTGFERKYIEMDYYTPLGPQAIGNLFLKNGASSYDQEKNDIWGLGNIF